MRPDSVPSATVNRLFTIKPTSIKLIDIGLSDTIKEYGFSFTVDTSVPVIASVFVNAKETLEKAHDITLE